MTPTQCAAVPHVVEPVTSDIDGFLSGLSEERRAEADLFGIYDFMESDELRPSMPPAIKKFLIDCWVQRLYGETPTREDPSFPFDNPRGPGEMIRLLQSWRSSAGRVADQLPALDLERTAKAIRAELDGIEKVPSVPLTDSDHEEFREFLRREEQAARKVKVILETVLAAGAKATGTPGGKGWRDVITYLEDCYRDGSKWQSLEYYAQEIGVGVTCVRTTIRDRARKEIQDWAAGQRGASAIDALPLEGAVIDSVADTKTADPADITEKADVDWAMEYLLEEYAADNPKLKSELLSKTPAERRAIADIVYSDGAPDIQDKIMAWRKAKTAARR